MQKANLDNNLTSRLIMRPAEQGDVAPFMAHIRPADRQECLVNSGNPAGVSLKKGIELGGAKFIALPDGTPLVMWGIRQHPGYSQVGIIWAMATTHAEEHVFTLYRAFRPSLNAALAEYPTLWNIAWEKNDLHIRWLGRIGAEFIAHHPGIGALGEPFLEFIITRASIASLARRAA